MNDSLFNDKPANKKVNKDIKSQLTKNQKKYLNENVFN